MVTDKISAHVLIKLIESWRQSLDRRGYSEAVLMHLSKALDTTNHELLIAKLHAYGFNKESLELILDYLSNRQQRTKIYDNFSSWAELIEGVPQGSALGPLLLNTYINDLFYLIEFTDACNFADDTTFFECDSDLEHLMEKLEHDTKLAIEWFKNKYMKLYEDVSATFLQQDTDMKLCWLTLEKLGFGKVRMKNYLD